MRIVFALGLFTLALTGCGGTVVENGGTGGHTGTGGHGTSATTSTTGATTTSTGSTSTSTSSSTSTATTSSSTSTSSTGGVCGSCMPGFICCNGACVNPDNDIDNCGHCGGACTGPSPYCHKGTCETPPCAEQDCGSVCCGTTCCTPGQLCCDIYGPVVLAGPLCTDPVGGTCPGGCTACVCASPGTPIATPQGDRPIADLRAGDLVYSVERDAIVAVPVLRAQRMPVHDHHVVRVALASGAVLEISPRHPTADGRTFGDLRAGDTLDRALVTSAELVPYAHPFTYDILPASETHTYFAGGALIGTTMTAR